MNQTQDQTGSRKLKLLSLPFYPSFETNDSHKFVTFMKMGFEWTVWERLKIFAIAKQQH